MRDRGGDRRAYARFEIMGTLAASLETWRRMLVRNLSAGGVSIATEDPYSVGTTLRGRLSVRGHVWDVQGEVKRVAESTTEEDGYTAGVAFKGQEIPMNELMGLPQAPLDSSAGPNRRRGERVECAGDADLAVPAWTTVSLKDLSVGGTMFVSPVVVGVGTSGSLRARLGDRAFSAEVDVRRVAAVPPASYSVASSFASMDEESRRNLAAFLTVSGADNTADAKDGK